MASYQDIETRLRTVEAQLEFVMRSFTVNRTKESKLIGFPPQTEVRNLLDLYREFVAAPAMVIPGFIPDPNDSTDEPLYQVNKD